MDRPKDAGQKLLRSRLALQLYQFLVEAVQVLAAFDKKILNDFVHRLIRRLIPCDAGTPVSCTSRAPGSNRSRAQGRTSSCELLSLRHIGIRGHNLSCGLVSPSLYRRLDALEACGRG